MGHVAGYSIYNDVSVRDYQRHAQQIAAGKNFVGTGPFGPWMVTTDEIGRSDETEARDPRQRQRRSEIGYLVADLLDPAADQLLPPRFST